MNLRVAQDIVFVNFQVSESEMISLIVRLKFSIHIIVEKGIINTVNIHFLFK